MKRPHWYRPDFTRRAPRGASGMLWGVVSLAAAVGCGGTTEPAADPTPVGSAARAPAPPERLTRDAVVATVEAGLSNFLQRVVVEASIDAGRFEGFRILALQPENFWRGVDLHAGDVVTAVNGQSIEQPEAAFAVFESLRTASELVVTYEREGETKQLVFPISGPPQPKPAAGDKG